MSTTLTAGLVVLGLAASVAVGASTAPDPPRTAVLPTTACKTEDSASCFWDAGMRGNGRGASYWTDDQGRPHYLDPQYDH